jgi:hypothetical protein
MKECETKMTDTWNLANIQRNIAKDVWPNGAILSCRGCRFSERISSGQAGDYLKHGWPNHCGVTMSCKSASESDRGSTE